MNFDSSVDRVTILTDYSTVRGQMTDYAYGLELMLKASSVCIRSFFMPPMAMVYRHRYQWYLGVAVGEARLEAFHHAKPVLFDELKRDDQPFCDS